MVIWMTLNGQMAKEQWVHAAANEACAPWLAPFKLDCFGKVGNMVHSAKWIFWTLIGLTLTGWSITVTGAQSQERGTGQHHRARSQAGSSSGGSFGGSSAGRCACQCFTSLHSMLILSITADHDNDGPRNWLSKLSTRPGQVSGARHQLTSKCSLLCCSICPAPSHLIQKNKSNA